MGKYLGFQVGHHRVEKVWDKAADKWEKRVKEWVGKRIGLQFWALVYNVFSGSVLRFLGQWVEIQEWILKTEDAMMLKSASGQAKWASKIDLWNMGRAFSIGRSFD